MNATSPQPGPDWSAALEHLARVDRPLGRLIERVGPCTLRPRHGDIFYSLARSIVFQQLAGAAAAAIMGRVEALFGTGPCTAEHISGASEEQLRSAGLSRNKMAALKDLAAKTLDGTVPTEEAMLEMDEEEIIERLVQVRGIGRWTAEMMLMFRLCRPDLLPLDDYGVRKGFQRVYRLPELPTKQQLLKRGERWRPWRTVASWYMWRAAELPKAKSKKTSASAATAKAENKKPKTATKSSRLSGVARSRTRS